MVVSPVIRHLLMDRESLTDYSRGVLPNFQAVTRRLFLQERSMNVGLPDHYYHSARESVFEGIRSLQELLSEGLAEMAANHLELTDLKVHVQRNRWRDWQKLVTLCPPLVLISANLWRTVFDHGNTDMAYLTSFLSNVIEPNVRFTCLPHPELPQMDSQVEREGFWDLHVHFNGATEIDIAWQVFLRRPDRVYRQFREAAEKYEPVREFIEQEQTGFTVLDLYRRLKMAQLVRRILIARFFPGITDTGFINLLDAVNPQYLLSHFFPVNHLIPQHYRHPLDLVFDPTGNREHGFTDTTLETLFMIQVMDHLAKFHSVESDSIDTTHTASLFHYYLLVSGFVNRMMVHQINQCGFEQFQKITLHDLRSNTEKFYENRFLQMHGNDLINLAVLEGRFSIKDSPQKNRKIISRINRGWDKFIQRSRSFWVENHKCENSDDENNLDDNSNTESARIPELRLVGHFIKKRENESVSNMDLRTSASLVLNTIRIRHQHFRIDTWIRAKALAAILNYPDMNRLVGVDTAANELDAPPEVFAPAFRLLRRSGMKRCTYHAGEDFHHLLGGLRAIFEAVNFLEFQAGDRIGHGLAAGIDPGIWRNRVTGEIYIRRGEWLDDLIFAYHLITHSSDPDLQRILSEISSRIESLGVQVYQQYSPSALLEAAWLMRRYCPFHILNRREDARNMLVWSDEEFALVNDIPHDDSALNLLRLYHTVGCRLRYREMIRIESEEIFTEQHLRLLQNQILKDLHRIDIALEILPTSNVRISFYTDYHEHHFQRWLGLQSEPSPATNLPSVVLGSDDPGIFATNIRNEYTHVYCQLVDSGMGDGEATAQLNRIISNCRAYGFNR